MLLKKMGGYICLAGGCVGITASVFTLVMGGMGAAFEQTVSGGFLNQGWVLLVCSLMAVIFGPLAVVGQAKVPGLIICVAALMGIIVGEVLGGGGLVTRVLMVPLLGGIMTFLGERRIEAEALIQPA